jgi:hypothetical protein
MKREFAATLLFVLLASTAAAGEVQSQELAPPASKPDELTSLIRKSLTEQTPSEMTPPARNYEFDWQLYSSELWIEGLPESPGPSLDALARHMQPYADVTQDKKLPTSVELNRGHWKANFAAKVEAASAPVTVVPVSTFTYTAASSPTGGTGALSGRLEYDVSAWQFYGGTNRALVANADGTFGVNNTVLGGTYYRLPDTLYGGKIGTGFEVNPVGDAKTRLEYRQMFGTTEGFIAAERIVPFQQHLAPDNSGVNALKAGINRKF